MALFGEERICEAFQSHPPDLIVVVHKETSEFGFRFFGNDYARRLGAWIKANYRPVWLRGPPPLRGDEGGILLMERRSRSEKKP